jgi:predicted amino acid-binding ACT domain protein
MMRAFAIELTDRPGELGRVATALSRYGVNLKAVTGLATGHYVLVRIIADDVEAARSALEGAGIKFTEGEVVQVLLENRAGELAAVTTKLAEAKVNLRAIYLTGVVDNLVELAIVTDDPKKTKRMLE